MTVRDFQALYDYGCWANHKLFDAMAQLAPGQFTQEVAGAYGSVRGTLVHMLSAEWGWLERCGGPARGPALAPAEYPTLDSVTSRWSDVEKGMREFLSGLQDSDLERRIEFAFGSGPKHVRSLGQVLQHLANHGSHHRGQVALLLRALGHAPGNVDLLFYQAG